MIIIADKNLIFLCFITKMGPPLVAGREQGVKYNLPGVGDREMSFSNLVVHKVLSPD